MPGERIQRPLLERTGPLRSVTTAYRRSDPRAPRRPRRDGPITSTEDVVIEAVKLGYRIVDDQILRGQAFARRLRGAGLDSDSGDFTDVVDQAMNLTKHLAVMLVEMAETSTQPRKVLRALLDVMDEERKRPKKPKPAPAPTDDAAEAPEVAPPSVPIEVRSSRAARVALRLTASLSGKPEVYPLYHREDSRHALGQVEFIAHEGGFVLRVVVSDKSPPGTYRGYAVDPKRQQPVALIEVEVSP